jgi:hypothetical protein
MARARRREEWSRTAAIMALTANINRDATRRSRPYTAADFDPTHERPNISGAAMAAAMGLKTVQRKVKQ